MKTAPTETEICRKYRNEDAHSEHVARLAVQIFDGVRELFGLDDRARALLDSAARLHDAGYAVSPAGHAAMSARIIRREGIAGMSDAEVRLIAEVSGMHSGVRLTGASKGRGKAVKLAAILRVADGLDRGHVQGTVIERISRRGQRVRIDCVQGVYKRDISSAESKADLWERLTGIRPVFTDGAEGGRRAGRYGHLYSRNDPASEMYRKLISLLYRIAADNCNGAYEGAESVHLHDIRVALRRARSVLRFFRPLPGVRDQESLESLLKRLCSQLGLMRDLQARLELFEAIKCDTSPGIEKLKRVWKGEIKDEMAKIRSVLRGSTWSRCMEMMKRLSRIDAVLPAAVRTAVRSRDFAQKRIGRALEKMGTGWFACPGIDESVALHEFRKRVRKLRYAAEICAPVLGRRIVRLEAACKRLAEALGRIHDADMLMSLDDRGGGMLLDAGVRRRLQYERKRCYARVKEHAKELREAVSKVM